MKKVFLVAILAVAGMWSVNAQKFGVKAGYNLANVLPNDQSAPIFGLHIGGIFEWKITENISLLPEVRYSIHGSKNSVNSVISAGVGYMF